MKLDGHSAREGSVSSRKLQVNDPAARPIERIAEVVGIPEPGTYALMGAGLLALAWMKLRRGAAPSEAAH